MDLLLHRNDFSLSDGWVQGVLHLFLKLVLAFPKEDLLLSLNDVNQDVTLLLLQLSDLVLKLNGLILHLLELLFELHLNVEVIISQLLLPFIVLVNQVIQLVHLKHLVLLRDFQLTDRLVVLINL